MTERFLVIRQDVYETMTLEGDLREAEELARRKQGQRVLGSGKSVRKS